MMDTKFHLAFKVKDIESTKEFYHKIMGCEMGRETKEWVDFNFFGHQLSAHVSNDIQELDYCGHVENIKVPIPHFGCILTTDVFNSLKIKLIEHQIKFIVEPQTRYKGRVGEQETMFILDFSNNAIEFKAYSNPLDIFE